MAVQCFNLGTTIGGTGIETVAANWAEFDILFDRIAGAHPFTKQSLFLLGVPLFFLGMLDVKKTKQSGLQDTDSSARRLCGGLQGADGSTNGRRCGR